MSSAMNNNTSNSGLQQALELAQARRDAAAQALASSRQAWLAGQVQLDQLKSYSQESGGRWSTRSGSCTPDLMRHHYQFMERLNHAISLQSRIIAEQGESIAREAAALREAEGRLESLRQLCLARRREWQRAQDLREQKLSDERATLRRARVTDTVNAELR